MNTDEVLIHYMNEHYAHARDHEHLRAEITAVLCAASFVLVGLIWQKDAGLSAPIKAYSGIIVLMMGVLNLRLIWLHQIRADAHIKTATAILKDLENRLWQPGQRAPSDFREVFDDIKKGNLGVTWYAAPALVIILGLGTALYHWLPQHP